MLMDDMIKNILSKKVKKHLFTEEPYGTDEKECIYYNEPYDWLHARCTLSNIDLGYNHCNCEHISKDCPFICKSSQIKAEEIFALKIKNIELQRDNFLATLEMIDEESLIANKDINNK